MIIKDSTTPQMRRYTTLWNSKIALIQSVTDGVSRHVKIKLLQFDIRQFPSQGQW